MVHALERARWHLVPGGVLVCVQPRTKLRPFIAVAGAGGRRPVGALINPVFEPVIGAAEATLDGVVADGRLELIGRANRQFRVNLKSLAELRRYIHLGQRPPRFPPGARKRLQELWKLRTPGSRIEVTEYLAVIALRNPSRPSNGSG